MQYTNDNNATAYSNAQPREISSTYSGGAAQTLETKKEVSPTRFWKWYTEKDFVEDSFSVIAKGNFGEVKKARLKDGPSLQRNKRTPFYGNSIAACKYPLGKKHNFTKQFNALSHEVSCTLILHPSLVNYIGGLYLGNGTADNAFRVGVVMEFVDSNLRTAIEQDTRLKDIKVQVDIAKQIASGMNFLHSLNPFILHRDLRTPNILINSQLECKIADFGISDNLGYQGMQHQELYTSLVPPECKREMFFTKKGDVYFFGWAMVELAISRKPDEDYNIEQTIAFLSGFLNGTPMKEGFRNIIAKCLEREPDNRPLFFDICSSLDIASGTPFDLQLIALSKDKTFNSFVNNKGATKNAILSHKDALERTLVHEYCIYGNVNGLKEVVGMLGPSCLAQVDKYGTNCAHFAARNGHLDVLQYLAEMKFAGFNDKEKRFDTSPLILAIAMKHIECVIFLSSLADQDALNNGLISGCQEANIFLVKLFIEKGANLQAQDPELTFTPLCWACRTGNPDIVQYLLEKGADVNTGRHDTGVSPLYMASQEGHREVVDTLIRWKADVNKTTNDGTSPLFVASQNGHEIVVGQLLSNGGNPNKGRNHDNCSPLFISAQKGFEGIVKLLLSNGARTDFHMNNGNSPLIIAAYEGNEPMVKLLLSFGADPKHKGNSSETAAVKARKQGHSKIADLLESIK